MNKLSLILPLSIFLAVACDSNQEPSSVNTEKSAVEDVVIEKAVTSVESAEVAAKKDVATAVDDKSVEAKEVVAKPELKVSMSGEQVYKKSCQSCHASGAAGAPKLGDAVAWKSRIAKGNDALYLSALQGVPGTAMMAKGTCGACSAEELNAAVDYMTSKVN